MTFPRDRALERELTSISAEDRRRLQRPTMVHVEPSEVPLSDRRVSSLVIKGTVRSHRSITRIDFVGVQLDDTRWDDTRFDSIHWVDASIENSRFSSSVFEECALFDAHLTEVIFESCEFKNCLFGSCWTSKVTFRDCTFEGCDFVFWSDSDGVFAGCLIDGCTVDQLSVSRSTWSRLQCRGSKLAKCRFSATSTHSVTFADCQLQGIRWLGGTHPDVEIRGGEGSELVWYQSTLGSLLIGDRAQVVDLRLAGSAVARFEVRESTIRSLSTKHLEEVTVAHAELTGWSWIDDRAPGRASVKNSILSHVHMERVEFDDLAWSSVLLQGSLVVIGCAFEQLNLFDIRHADSLVIEHHDNSYPPNSTTLEHAYGPWSRS